MLWLNPTEGGADRSEQDDDDMESRPNFSAHTLHSIRLAVTKPLLRFFRATRNRVQGRRQVYEVSGLNRVTRANVGHQLR